MRRVTSRITIGKYQFTAVVGVEIESSWETLTDRCKITIPRKLSFDGKTIAQGDAVFAKKDKVKVELGYDFEYATRFEGYVTRIYPGTLVVLACEDAMYLLKEKAVDKYSKAAVTLKAMLTDIMPPNVPFECADTKLGKFSINAATVAQTLEALKNTYGLYSWCRGGKLYVGWAYLPNVIPKRHVFRFGTNVDTEQNTMEYMKTEDVKIRVKAISMLPDNKKIEIEEPKGETDGEIRTLHFYDLPEKDLRERAKSEIDSLRFTGFRGGFETFGIPEVQHGDVAVLQDKVNADRNGMYFVKSVKIRCGLEGYWQGIGLDKKF